MNIEELISNVTTVSKDTKYWFVRTDEGKYYDIFLKYNFIAIGWNFVTLEEIKNPDLEFQIKEKIIREEKFDTSKNGTKRRASQIYNKLKKFVELKKGDVIVIPSQGSHRKAFGIVEDSNVFIDIENSYGCEFYKRKRVKWIVDKSFNELDPNFYQMRFTQHTISEVSDFGGYIDNVINTMYVKDDEAHLVLNVKTKEKININALLSLIQSVQKLTEDINKEFGFNEEIGDGCIKLMLESPGHIEFIQTARNSLIILAIMLSVTCCGDKNDLILPKEIDTAMVNNEKQLSIIREKVEQLQIDKSRLTSHPYGRH